MPFFTMVCSPSVIIRDLDVMGSVSRPAKTDAPLIIDPDGDIQAGSQVDQWITWASRQADCLDPLSQIEPS